MDALEIKKKLKSAWYYQLQIEREMDEIAQLKSLAEKMTPFYSVTAGCGGGDSSNSALEDNVIRIMEAEKRNQETVAELLTTREEIHQLIDTLEDDQLRLVLQYRYINNIKWEEIAFRMGISWRWVHELHSRALKALAENKVHK